MVREGLLRRWHLRKDVKEVEEDAMFQVTVSRPKWSQSRAGSEKWEEVASLGFYYKNFGFYAITLNGIISMKWEAIIGMSTSACLSRFVHHSCPSSSLTRGSWNVFSCFSSSLIIFLPFDYLPPLSMIQVSPPCQRSRDQIPVFLSSSQQWTWACLCQCQEPTKMQILWPHLIPSGSLGLGSKNLHV